MGKERKSALQVELKQSRAFRSTGQEASIAIVRTADVLWGRIGALTESFGITPQQYNVLRILRGSHPDPLPTLEIAERMIERQPGITRLLDRIEAKGLVRRERCPEDRRLMHCWITPEGLDLLAAMDDPVDDAEAAAVRGLSVREQRQLIELLARVRQPNG